MGNQYSLPILYVILGAAALLMCAYAVARISGNVDLNETAQYSAQQIEYMRGIRDRNFNRLRWMVRNSEPSRSGPSVVSI
jgi:hypothetical protein